MGITKKNHYRGNDFNNQELKDAKSLQLNQDATSSDEAVRKAQAETLSAQAAQDILVEASVNASSSTAFTSQSLVGFLAAKQDNMSIEGGSTGYLEIVNGTEIKVKQLLVSSVTVDTVDSTLAAWLVSNPSHDLEEGDVLILTSATDNQQRSWIHNGASTSTVADFTRLQTDYNEASIRAMFSVGSYLNYDVNSGLISIDRGNNAGQLGAHTLDVDTNEFSVITGSTTLAILKALESFIVQVDASATGGATTIDTRLTNLSGVTGNSLETFNGSTFTDNQNIKQVLQQSENKHEAADADRAAIRSEVSATESALEASINTEKLRALSAEASESSARQSADNTLQSNINTTNTNLTAEETRALAAEQGLDDRLDVIESLDTSLVGSIAHGVAEAESYTDSKLALEATVRASVDAGLQSQIDALNGAFIYRGYVGADGRIVHVDTNNLNHNLLFKDVAVEEGDMYKVNADITITFDDASELEVFAGDSLLAIGSSVVGSANATKFHVGDNTEAADILREGELESGYLRRQSGTIEIIADSLDRAKLHPDVETDIDNKVLKAGDEMTGALFINKEVTGGTGYVGGYDYAAYVKQKSVDTDSLTDTQRALLVENLVYTNGSGNPFDLDYANAITSASHYSGSSNTMSVATVGVNGEANVTSPSAAVYATGSYASATSSQLGVNTGGTFVAQNAATSNLGVFSFSDTAGAANNRAAYFALSTDAIDFDSYRVARVANPLPVQDAALVLDDYTGAKHALYVNGKSEFAGKVIVPSATADNEAINLGDVKSKEFTGSFTLGASTNWVVNHNLGTKKLILSLWYEDEEVTGSFDIERTSNNSITVYNATTETLTGVEVCIYALS